MNENLQLSLGTSPVPLLHSSERAAAVIVPTEHVLSPEECVVLRYLRYPMMFVGSVLSPVFISGAFPRAFSGHVGNACSS